jgi:simple sugar transport system ATP-binding protein
LSVFGLTHPESGEILIDGEPQKITSPRAATKYGISYLPEDRLTQGIFQHQSIGNNIVITVLKRFLGALGLIQTDKKAESEESWIKRLSIKTPSKDAPASSLSGGNQQRVVIAKWLATDPKVFILDGPTIGIDIASKGAIHQTIRDLAKNGMAIIMISDEIDEVLKNCNRVLVMKKGRIASEITDPASVDEDEVFKLVTGETTHEVA